MLINLTDVLSCEEKTVIRTASIDQESFDSDLGSFPITEKDPFELAITNLGGKKLRIAASARLSVRIPCDRCLEDVKTPLVLVID